MRKSKKSVSKKVSSSRVRTGKVTSKRSNTTTKRKVALSNVTTNVISKRPLPKVISTVKKNPVRTITFFGNSTNKLSKLVKPVVKKQVTATNKNRNVTNNNVSTPIIQKPHSQKETVLSVLQKKGSINTNDAFDNHRISRLSAYIYTLRKEGFKIVAEHKTDTKTKYGHNKTFVEYRLVKSSKPEVKRNNNKSVASPTNKNADTSKKVAAKIVKKSTKRNANCLPL